MIRRASVLALGLLAGCAGSAPIVLPLREEVGPGPQPTARIDQRALGASRRLDHRLVPTSVMSPRSCRLAVVAVDDKRQNRDTLGAVGNQPLHAEGVREWVADGVRALDDSHQDGRPGEGAGPAPDLTTRIEIERIYARTVTSQMEGVVALRATFTAADGTVTERSYRGSGTRPNWASGGSEFAALLNESLASAVAQIAADAARLCPAR